MRRGEALGLHWTDVHLPEKTLLVRWNLTAVNNSRLYLGHPKTKAGRNWVSLSPRVAAALERQAALALTDQLPDTPLEGLVFCQPDGSPLRPQSVLTELRRRSEEIGLPRIGVHDLRHTAATIMISSRVPLAVVSKTLRHSTLSPTVNLYGHLLPYAARDAVTAIDKALDGADRKHPTRPPQHHKIGRLETECHAVTGCHHAAITCPTNASSGPAVSGRPADEHRRDDRI